MGFGDLLGTAIGTIIGAGIMTLLSATIAMTGRSVPFSSLIAAGITICQFPPTILVTGTVRLCGGQYTMVAMLIVALAIFVVFGTGKVARGISSRSPSSQTAFRACSRRAAC